MITITVARKPIDGTVAHNVLLHGTGGINIDASRIEFLGDKPQPTKAPGWASLNAKASKLGYRDSAYDQTDAEYAPSDIGRFPTNMILTLEAAAGLDRQSGERPGMSGGGATDNRKSGREVIPSFNRKPSAPFIRGDTGGASRFFKTLS